MKAKVLSVNLSEKRGTNKYSVKKGNFIKNYGLEGDGHSGDWHRQVSIFDISSLSTMNKNEIRLCNETYSENITIEGTNLCKEEVGTKVKIGEAIFEITQIGKEYIKDPLLHTEREKIMHEEGVFAIVKESGIVKKGDSVIIIK
ncbi:MOSC domain-containing protein [Helicovermis profundi]|uniref:MOSC domain-containing protein n=1 Tax=Helicovermis profundi TaxID=3065157 RepID=A0AAU9EPB8_9FIRM|nr:MOSC domain-containing protein [Clostridia bacterium S502]